MSTIAITRGIAASLARCELTHLERVPIDVERARSQHAVYLRTLRELGVRVIELDADEAHPDCVFVEDAALVFDEVAVMTRPGAESRRGELPAIEAALADHREIVRVEAPATVDGGDVLVLGKDVFVGLSSRTDRAGVEQLADALSHYGYRVTGVEVRGCLHLKSAATALDDRTAIVNPAMIDPSVLGGVRTIDVDVEEPWAANVVRVEGRVLHAEAFPRTRERIEDAGYSVVPVPADELAKAEGALTCCSLVFAG